jgi:hypothetical protein
MGKLIKIMGVLTLMASFSAFSGTVTCWTDVYGNTHCEDGLNTTTCTTDGYGSTTCQ